MARRIGVSGCGGSDGSPMGNYSSAVVTMVPGCDELPDGTQVYRVRATTPPAWRRTRSAARTKPVISAPIPLAPIEEDDETSSSVAGGRRRTLQAGEEGDCESLAEVLGGLERMLERQHLGALRRQPSRGAERDEEDLYGRAAANGINRDDEELFGPKRGSREPCRAERNSGERLPWDPADPEPEPEPGAGDEESCSWERGTVERAAWVSRVTDEPVPRDASSERSDGSGGGGEARHGRLFLVQGTETRRRHRANRRLTAEQRRRALRDPDEDGDGDDWGGSVRRRRSEPRGEAGHLLVRHRRERRQAAYSLAQDAVKRWYLPWLRDGYLASGDEEEPPPPDDSDEDTRSLSYIAAQRAAEESAAEAARSLHWQTHSARYAARATVQLLPEDVTGDPAPALTSGLTSDLTEVILGRGRSPEAVRSEAGLLDPSSEICKERCIDHYLEVYCSDRAPLRPAGYQDAARLRRSLWDWVAAGARDGTIETGEWCRAQPGLRGLLGILRLRIYLVLGRGGGRY